jgi:hypothetical protein
MPFVDCADLTTASVGDLGRQSTPVDLLLIDNGSRERDWITKLAYDTTTPVQVWHHDPPLPSLSATWNRGLRWAWECGADHCLVVNNDVRLLPQTYEALLRAQRETGAWFVTAVNVGEEAYSQVQTSGIDIREVDWSKRGGPDFSCFLITRACHLAYPFDENFIPAYCEDLDTHRRMMLGGDGARIFGVCVPYLHYASGTLKGMGDDRRQRMGAQIDQARQYYARKWGGTVNQEHCVIPFDEALLDGVTTPDLQAWIRAGNDVNDLLDGVRRG